ncbi:MAG TPA: hypothetical protein VJ598_02680 [Albitalea sp.]|nr:hypothetical protein [Albitalea sp.]
MSLKWIRLAAFVAAWAAMAAQAADSFWVQVPATLDPSAPIGEGVRRECSVEQLVGNHVFQSVSERLPGARALAQVDQAGADPLLKLTIFTVYGAGGGGWSGPKSMMIRADLTLNGEVSATKVFRRQSSGGAFGGLTGTCPIMERIAIALGKDVAGWMAGVPLPKAAAAASAAEAASSSR